MIHRLILKYKAFRVWLINLQALVAQHDPQVQNLRYWVEEQAKAIEVLRKQVTEAEAVIRDRTGAFVDIGFPGHGDSSVILLGSYHGRPYVEVSRMATKDFESFVRQIQEINRHATLHRVDAPQAFKAYLDHVGMKT